MLQWRAGGWSAAWHARPDEPPKLTVVSRKDALRLARAVPCRAVPGVGEMAIEGLTAEEWQAFEAALAER